MRKGLFNTQSRLANIDRNDGPLKKLSGLIDGNFLWPALPRFAEVANPSKSGRPIICPLLKFKMSILQSPGNFSEDALKRQIPDRQPFLYALPRPWHRRRCRARTDSRPCSRAGVRARLERIQIGSGREFRPAGVCLFGMYVRGTDSPPKLGRAPLAPLHTRKRPCQSSPFGRGTASSQSRALPPPCPDEAHFRSATANSR